MTVAERTSSRRTASPRKALRLPAEGDYLTDGVRLVEVIGRDRDGYKVLDARVPTEVGSHERDPRDTEVLNPEVVVRLWRVVEYEPWREEVAGVA